MTNDRSAERGRLLLELGALAADQQGIEAAARLACLLDLQLHGVFVEDEALLRLAGLPFARELRLPSHAWASLQADEMTLALSRTAAQLQRAIRQHCARLGIGFGFEIVRGDPAVSLARLSASSDILALATPGSAAGQAFGCFPGAWRAALGSAASVLLLPPRIVRGSGPVASVVAENAEPALRLALRIAAGTGEALLALIPPGEERAAEVTLARLRAEGFGDVPIAMRSLSAMTDTAIIQSLYRQAERLLILARGAPTALVEEAPPRLAWRRRVPVLMR